eukprot:gene19211-biopygen3999
MCPPTASPASLSNPMLPPLPLRCIELAQQGPLGARCEH